MVKVFIIGYVSNNFTAYLYKKHPLILDYKVLEFTIDSGDRNCESMAFELISSDGGGTSGAKIYINDINVDFRLTNKRPQ